MLKGISALPGAGKLKRIAWTVFWLTFISAASEHNILLGMVLYPMAAFTLVMVVLAAFTPLWLVLGGLLFWYRRKHGRLPLWMSRLAPARLRAGVRVWWASARDLLSDVFPGHRRPVRRRWPRAPEAGETPTDEFPVLLVPERDQPSKVTPAADAADGEPAGASPLP